MIESAELVPIGKFRKTHALGGELNAELDIDPLYCEEDNPLVVSRDGIFVPFFVESIRPKGATTFLIKLKGVDSVEEAREMVNETIYAMREPLKEYLSEDDEEFIVFDEMRGWRLMDPQGNGIGVVGEVDRSTDNLLLLVRTPDGDTVYVPLADDFIVSADAGKKELVMDLPDGILDVNRS